MHLYTDHFLFVEVNATGRDWSELGVISIQRN